MYTQAASSSDEMYIFDWLSLTEPMRQDLSTGPHCVQVVPLVAGVAVTPHPPTVCL